MNPQTPYERVEAEQEDARNIAHWILCGKHGATDADALVVPARLALTLARELEAIQKQAQAMRAMLEECSSFGQCHELCPEQCVHRRARILLESLSSPTTPYVHADVARQLVEALKAIKGGNDIPAYKRIQLCDAALTAAQSALEGK